MCFEDPKKIKKKLIRLRNRLPMKSVDVNDMKWVFISDVHKGCGDGADDFKGSEQNYLNAMSYYYKHGYTLVHLGDIEELWENRIEDILSRHRETFKWEKKFFNKKVNKTLRYYRIWGNHDDLWDEQKSVKKHLLKPIGPLDVHEGMRLKITNKGKKIGEIFLTHGHQGSFTSDTIEKFSRVFIRYAWRPFQRTFHIKPNSLSKKFKAKPGHEKAMHAWADSIDGIVLITGHTHHPVFMAESHEYVLKEKMRSIQNKIKKENDKKKIGKLKKDLNKISKKFDRKIEEAGGHPFYKDKDTKPSYFNTGCCIYDDGDITTIEIGESEKKNKKGKKYPEIRLVKWDKKSKDQKKEPIPLKGHDLLDVFRQCS